MGGKIEWLSHGLPYDGEADLVVRHLTPDTAPGRPPRIATCRPDDRLPMAGPTGIERWVVLNEDGVVQGTVDGGRSFAPGTIAESVMDIAVPTVRPSEEVSKLDERMIRAERASMVVTTPEGTYLGTYFRG